MLKDMSEAKQFYIGGNLTSSSETTVIKNPYINSEIAHIHLAQKEHIDKSILAAQEAFQITSQYSSYERSVILQSIASQLKQRKEEFAQLITAEAGKPITFSSAEVDRAVSTFEIASEEAKRINGEVLSLDVTAPTKGKQGIVNRFPIGIIACISPFNFPLNLAVHKIAPAIAAGCPIILKPASATPLSTLELAKIIARMELPKGAVSILPMDRKTGNQLVTNGQIALLSFTGSPEVGWKMKQEAGKKKVVLELGGNAGVIITPTADLELAVKRCIAGGFAYSGQICIHVQRIFVQKLLFGKFTGLFMEAVKRMHTKNPEDHATEMSVMIDEENAKRVEAWVNEAIKAGAKLLCGGKREGTYYQPTVLTNTNTAMKVNCEEVFGPVVIIEPYEQFSDATAMINDSRFGLQAGIFTNEIREMDEAFAKLQVGGVILNDVPLVRFDHMPYGGVKDSGQGREGVKYAIMDMMEARILVK